MQFFDLNRKFHLDDILTPHYTLEQLGQQDWRLAKIRVEYDYLEDHQELSGQAVLQSNQNIQIELDWLIQDTGHELQVLFKGIETKTDAPHRILVSGAQLVDEQQQVLSAQALCLWLDGTLLPLLPHIRREIKARLNLWDYVEYDV